jgi:hypothetical protein
MNMPKFLVVEKGFGEGCDYTIGCNMNYEIVEADSIEALVQDTINGALFEDGDGREQMLKDLCFCENELKECIIVPMTEAVYVKLRDIEREHNNQVRKRKAQKAIEDEKEQLKKLQAKYGEGNGS